MIVTDANGCSTNANISINQPTQLLQQFQILMLHGCTDGAAIVFATEAHLVIHSWAPLALTTPNASSLAVELLYSNCNRW